MCGFVGMIGSDPAAPQLFVALQALQHRGQDAAGIGTLEAGGRFHLHKDLGLVSAAIPLATLDRLIGTAGIAHVRYPTAGTGINDREDAQPFLTRRPGILMAHNGNVTNIRALEAELRAEGLHVLSNCDSEAILLVLAEELTARHGGNHSVDDLVAALERLMVRVRGAYSVTAVMEIDGHTALIAFRDPHGIRPCVYGRSPTGAWMVASESVALDVLGFDVVGHIPAGSVAVFRDQQPPILRAVRPEAPKHCVFERIYFARPDSVTEEGRVNALRWNLGERLADEWKAKGLDADVVVAVPDTSRDAAQAMAERLSLPNREGFIKNRYSGRTFIMPNLATRTVALRLKLNPIAEVFAGKRVILVDDSIVRGTTMRRIVDLVKLTGPAEVHLAIYSPPVAHPCFYGIDMPSRDELIASRYAPADLEQGLARELGVTSLTFVTPEGLREVGGAATCTACFTGDYAVPVNDDERAYILKNRDLADGSRSAPTPAVQ